MAGKKYDVLLNENGEWLAVESRTSATMGHLIYDVPEELVERLHGTPWALFDSELLDEHRLIVVPITGSLIHDSVEDDEDEDDEDDDTDLPTVDGLDSSRGIADIVR